MKSNINELSELMKQVSTEMASDYCRNYRQSMKDSGTAGDLGEENWANLLRQWLPPTLKVVTKGRIIGHDGISSSPQVDIIVLKDVYPKKMIDKKLYLSSGVAAAFECKNTLRSDHITKAVKTAVKIKKLSPNREGSPYAELHAPVIYGLLAHSHNWKQEGSRPDQNITTKLLLEDLLSVGHPKHCIDLLCVSDLGLWASRKASFVLPLGTRSTDPGYSIDAASDYIAYTKSINDNKSHFTPIGSLITYLSRRLAWEIPSLRSLADHYFHSSLTGSGQIYSRKWNFEIFSKSVRQRVERRQLSYPTLGQWDEWCERFF